MFETNFSLLPYNTFHMDVRAEYFARFGSVENLRELLDAFHQGSAGNAGQRMVLGGGSNVLFTSNLPGLVLKNEIRGIQWDGEDNDYVYLKAGAGESWHGFVMHCLNHDLAGVENLALIPGNVGASPMQNIGAYGVEVREVFHALDAVDWETGEIHSFGLSDCAFGYRESVFKQQYRNRFIITSVTYRLLKKPQFHIAYGAIQHELEKMQVKDLTIQAVARAVMNIRQSKLPDPAVIGNAGSFFKNPEIDKDTFDRLKSKFPDMVGYPVSGDRIKLAAGWLIEHSGPEPGKSWKGYRLGDAGCHEKQALVLVNYGHASGTEIRDLGLRISGSVKDTFGVDLQPEVNII